MRGLDSSLVDTLDFETALGRIRTDILTDFVLAPHYSAVFVHAPDQLIDITKRLLRSGQYAAGIPIKVEIPKANGLSRPGCLPTLVDRVVYQLLVDAISPEAESQLDRSRVFSNVLLSDDADFRMFRAHDECWHNMLAALGDMCQDPAFPFVVRSDVANYFERIYQHNLVNLLRSSGCDARIVNLLEEVLLEFTGRDSHGIVQGVFPSDFLGNFYLAAVDDSLRVREIPSIRYVDDLYLFFPDELSARRGLFYLCKVLRSEGLSVNESKTKTLRSHELIEEETEVDHLFADAKEEIRGTAFPHSVESQYGFQTIWLPGELVLEPAQVELQAVEHLYTEGTQDVARAEKVERYCLPYLGRIGNAIAVDRSLRSILTRPHMARVYCNYLLHFVADDTEVSRQLESVVASPEMPYDWSLIWPIAALTEATSVSSRTVDGVIQILQDVDKSDALRSASVFLAARHGTVGQRRMIRHRYESEPSAFVREAILFASRYFPTNERNSCLRAWGSHSVTNSLIAGAVRASTRSQGALS